MTNSPIHAEVAVLRDRLRAFDAWPDAGDALLALMPASRRDSLAVTEKDLQWLPQVIHATLSGIDIGAQFPSIFQKLLASTYLRQVFLYELERAAKSI